MIDFGLAKKYLDASGKHVPIAKEQVFSGNMIFASKNAFNMVTQSRRDDLISLCYFMIYLVDGDLDFLDKDGGDDEEEDEAEPNPEK